MIAVVEHQMLVNLVADGVAIELFQQLAHGCELVMAEYLAGGVHRRIEKNKFGLVAERGLQLLPGNSPVRWFQAH